MNLKKYGQYKSDLFTKIGFNFIKDKKILDVGCGDGSDAKIFINEYKLITTGIDIYKNKKINSIKELTFKKGSIYNIPFDDSSFDYVFLHDVLHHIDEKTQSHSKHIEALKEIKRVIAKGGSLIIVEGNRYNPLFYPHMVRMLKHNHFTQKYFENLILEVFPDARFKYFECHKYPKTTIKIFKLYEYLMEEIVPRQFRSYNLAVVDFS